MAYTEEFLRDYQESVLDDIALPCALQSYIPVSYLTQGVRSVLLLRNQVGELLAMKMQPLGRETSLQQEFQILQSLGHPQIPKAICYLEENGVEYLVREYVDGVSLKELVSERASVAESTCKAIILSVCEVLQYLHAQMPPIIHRDIKPQNIILSPDGVCHLIDFGTARHFKEHESEDTVFMGTRVTAAPEQFGYRQTDVRSDIYGVGMLLRFLLTGGYDSSFDKTIHYGLRQIISRCTAFDPKHRYRSVTSLVRSLSLLRHRRLLVGLAAAITAAAVTLSALWAFSPLPEVQFASPLFEKAVRQQLHLDAQEPILPERLAEVTEIIICGQEIYAGHQSHDDVAWQRHDPYITTIPRGDIASLDDVALLPNLRVLVLDFQQIADLSPLAHLPLEQLGLTANCVTDLSPLVGNSTITAISLDHNPIADATVLAGLPSLRLLDIRETNVATLSGFAGSPIEELQTAGTPIKDFSPLATCGSLQVLNLSNPDAATVATVAQLTSLRVLSCYHAVIPDFSVFAKLQNLRHLDVYSSTLSSIAGLEQLPYLQYLNLGETDFVDVTQLQTLPSLSTVELRNTTINDFTPLLGCPTLRLVVFDESQRARVETQLPNTPFEVEIRPY